VFMRAPGTPGTFISSLVGAPRIRCTTVP